MKKLILLILLFIILLTTPIQTTFAKNENYARIILNNTYLYSTPNTNNDNMLFELPNSYFVQLISQYDETFYKVKYIDLVGYVKISEVQPVSTTPTKPYLSDITFRVYSSDGIYIRSTPSTKNETTNIKGEVSILDENIIYYGKIDGEECVKNRGNIWYYCKYKNDNETVLGYIYAGYCDMLSEIIENDEVLTTSNNPFKTTQTAILNEQLKPSNSIKNVILILTTLPSLVLIYMLFKPSKILNNKNKIKHKNKYIKTTKSYSEEDNY